MLIDKPKNFFLKIKIFFEIFKIFITNLGTLKTNFFKIKFVFYRKYFFILNNSTKVGKKTILTLNSICKFKDKKIIRNFF